MIAYEGIIRVEYHQLYVMLDEEADYTQDAYVGQQNGLLGAAVEGLLFCTTVAQDGRVGLRVEVLDEAPAIEAEAEDVVEVSVHPTSDEYGVYPWGDGRLAGFTFSDRPYRVRCSIVDLAAAIAS